MWQEIAKIEGPKCDQFDSTVGDLKCYQCEVRESAQCTDKYLLPCPANQAYDRCQTRIHKTKNDDAWIYKSCTLAPCSLRDESQTSGLGLNHCDRSQEEYDCVSCCKENGCNTGRGAMCRPTFTTIITAILLASFLSMQRFG
ncbi:uncharacterized protein CDAR_593651 [Caerostris darwini]|uniref:Uncharacterized protein n=1 Tax=Caerostris darwini TaxID=1538125 RepID=A0AAV4S0K7_9ARAC|nr:uncharacterized protein CDAR_593651 [Caerostris darwini]